jgi:uncharacterized protein YceH (UPF0502 family)
MEPQLDAIETRVLGCLVEKELATPEYYPLSLNALVNACNQKSNRDPVLDLSEPDVSRALASLGRKQYAIVSGEGGRVSKHRHFLVEKFDLGRPALAVLCELMLRGPQTPGELRTRAGRMCDFPDLAAVGAVLQRLEGEEPPMVACLPRQPGRKEQRYAQLFSALPADEPPASRQAGNDPEAAALRGGEADDRVARLESEVVALRRETDSLREEVAELTRLVLGNG